MVMGHLILPQGIIALLTVTETNLTSNIILKSVRKTQVNTHTKEKYF